MCNNAWSNNLSIYIFRYDEAIEVLESIIKRDETNAAPRKRRVAILKARGRIPEAIKELTEYLKRSVMYFILLYCIYWHV